MLWCGPQQAGDQQLLLVLLFLQLGCSQNLSPSFVFVFVFFFKFGKANESELSTGGGTTLFLILFATYLLCHLKNK